MFYHWRVLAVERVTSDMVFFINPDNENINRGVCQCHDIEYGESKHNMTQSRGRLASTEMTNAAIAIRGSEMLGNDFKGSRHRHRRA